MRDIACIKPTIENTDPAFAVGMQASCLVYRPCGYARVFNPRFTRHGGYFALMIGFFCNIQNKCAYSKQICILISSLQRFAGEKMPDINSACFIPHCKSASFLLKNAHSFEWVFLIFLFVKRSLMKKH